jgi:hypothetical protein
LVPLHFPVQDDRSVAGDGSEIQICVDRVCSLLDLLTANPTFISRLGKFIYCPSAGRAMVGYLVIS